MLPGNLDIMDEYALLFSFNDGQTFFGEKIGAEWKVEPFDNPISGKITSALVEPLRTLQTYYSDTSDIELEGLFFPKGILQIGSKKK